MFRVLEERGNDSGSQSIQEYPFGCEPAFSQWTRFAPRLIRPEDTYQNSSRSTHFAFQYTSIIILFPPDGKDFTIRTCPTKSDTF